MQLFINILLIWCCRDKKSRQIKLRASKEEALLEETRRKEKEDERKQLELEATNGECYGAKFAIASQSSINQSPNSQPASPAGRANGEHYFPKCPKRLLSTGGAKRVTPEELAIMLDSYAVPSPKTSPQLATKGFLNSNHGTVNA